MLKATVISALLLSSAIIHADGIIIPDPPFEPLAIKYHRVQVEIDDQTAHTDIDQVFLNPQPWDVEGTYIFPLPQDASFSAFSMHVDGEELAAEILPADEARQMYEDIVRQFDSTQPCWSTSARGRTGRVSFRFRPRAKSGSSCPTMNCWYVIPASSVTSTP